MCAWFSPFNIMGVGFLLAFSLRTPVTDTKWDMPGLQEDPAAQELLHEERKIFLWQSAFPSLAIPNNGTLFLLQAQACLWVPLATTLHFPTLGAPPPSPSGFHHTANPSPFPRTDLWSLSLSAQLLTWASQAVVSRMVVLMVCMALYLVCPPQSSFCTFL